MLKGVLISLVGPLRFGQYCERKENRYSKIRKQFQIERDIWTNRIVFRFFSGMSRCFLNLGLRLIVVPSGLKPSCAICSFHVGIMDASADSSDRPLSDVYPYISVFEYGDIETF